VRGEGAEKVDNTGVYHDMPKPSMLKSRLRVLISASVVGSACTEGSCESNLGR
jgi:hypothetical protein